MVKAYYSILQYIPDVERKEGANIGVVLFSEEKRFLDVKLSRSNERLRKIFGRELKVTDRMVTFYKKSFENRIQQERNEIETIENFRKFIESRGNDFALLPARYIKLSGALEQELNNLFEKLVGRDSPVAHRMSPARLTSQLEVRFKEKGIYHQLQRDFKFESHAFRKSIEFPFAYKNGKTNVIKPVVFHESNYESTACRWSVASEELKQKQIKLNVFATFATNGKTTEAKRIVKNILELNDALLRTDEEIENFTSEVVRAVQHTS